MNNTTKTNLPIAEDYLSLFKAGEMKYLIGTFQDGITLYKQQVRALNIFWALHKQKILSKEKTFLNNDGEETRMHIAVIGGGVAGLTFAAAALEYGYNVSIIEQKPMFMHLQHLCHTRIIHPHIYEWPSDGWDNDTAELPVLSWKSDTASNVANQIVEKFYRILAKKTNNPQPYLSTTVQKIESDFVDKGPFKISIKTRLETGTEVGNAVFADFLIYAPGYGIEVDKDKTNSETPSYWRNDDYAQPLITSKDKHYIISGVGDGGLIDLLRLKFRGFTTESFLAKIRNSPEQYQNLSKRIEQIKQDWLALAPDQRTNTWLVNQFQRIPEQYFKYIYDGYLIPRSVPMHRVKLVGKGNNYLDSLNLDKASALNTFMLFLLGRIEGTYFRYVSRDKTDLSKIKTNEKLIVRHGTDRYKALKQINDKSVTRKQFEELDTLQRTHRLYRNAIQLWKYSDLTKEFESNANKKRIEFFTGETVSLCSNFVCLLSNVIVAILKERSKKYTFRVTLHRIIEIDGELCYQQVTPYYGSSQSTGKSLGATYPLDRGNVGVSIQTGLPTLIVEKNSTDVREVFKMMNLEDDYDSKKYKAFFTLPIRGKSHHGNFSTNLVLYIDSHEPDFFDEHRIFDMIKHSTNGFVEFIEKMLVAKHLTMKRCDFVTPVATGKHDRRLSRNPCFIDVASNFKNTVREGLKLDFDQFHTFNLSANPIYDDVYGII